MTNQTPEEIVADPKNRIELTPREHEVLNRWLRSKQPSIAVETSERMFEMFLRGYDCEAIRKNHAGFSLGAILHARVTHRWDLGVEEYRQRLRSGIIDKAVTARLEAVGVVSGLISANAKHMGEGLLRYYKSGNPDDLPIKIESVRELKSLVETLQVLTTPPGKGGPGGSAPDLGAPPAPAPAPLERQLNQSEALALLADGVK